MGTGEFVKRDENGKIVGVKQLCQKHLIRYSRWDEVVSEMRKLLLPKKQEDKDQKIK